MPRKKLFVIAAAGNESRNIDEIPSYPAAYNVDAIISVASSNWNDEWSDFSNWGENVDLYAPGDVILSSWYDLTLVIRTYGTSMAAPMFQVWLAHIGQEIQS